MANGITGKVIIITGAISGIGKATAELMAAQGAKVVLGARRAENLKSIADTIKTNGGYATYAETDVTQREDMNSLVKLAVDDFGRLDVIVNNAGIAQLYRMEETDVDGWEQMIDVNIKGTLYGIAAAMPEFLKNGSGHFVKYHLYCRYRHRADDGCLCRNEECGAYDRRSVAPGIAGTLAGNGYFTWLCSNRICEQYKERCDPFSQSGNCGQDLYTR